MKRLLSTLLTLSLLTTSLTPAVSAVKNHQPSLPTTSRTWTTPTITTTVSYWNENDKASCTRDEFFTILVEIINEDKISKGLQPITPKLTPKNSGITDINIYTPEQQQTILILKELKLLNGDEHGKVNLNNPLTRAEFAVIFEKFVSKFFPAFHTIYGWGEPQDISKNSWFYKSAVNAINKEYLYYLSRHPKKYFSPNTPVSKEGVVRALEKLVYPNDTKNRLSKLTLMKVLDNNFDIKPVFKIENDKIIYSSEYIMNILNLNDLYDNKSTNPSDSLTKFEALKVIYTIGDKENFEDNIRVYNYENTSAFFSSPVEIYDDYNSIVNFFQNNFSGPQIPESELKSTITYNEIITHFEKLIKAFPAPISKDICSSMYLQNDRIANKADLNDISAKIILELNYIFPKNGKQFTLNTKVSTFPKNWTCYPFIANEVDKKVYEYDMDYPIELYPLHTRFNNEFVDRSERFIEASLGVDYRTIVEEDKLNELETISLVMTNRDKMSDYIKYVKENNIIVEATATMIPGTYGNSSARFEVKVNIISSNTRDSILYCSDNLKFAKNEFTLVIDWGFSSFSYGAIPYYLKDSVILSANIRNLEECGIQDYYLINN